MKVGLDASIPKFPRRFRRRVFFYITAITVLSAAAAFGFFYTRHRQFIHKDTSARGQYLVTHLAGQCDLGVLSGEGGYLKGPVDRVLREGDVLFVTVHDRAGKELRRGVKSEAGSLKPFRVPNARGVGRAGYSTETQRSGYREFVAPVTAPGADGTELAFGSDQKRARKVIGWVRLGLSEAPQRERLAALLRFSLYLSGGLLVLGLLAAAVVTWRVAGPIVKLTQSADEMRRGNLDQRVEITGHDELGQLADSFNRMAWNLKDTVEKLESLNRNLEAEVNRQTEDIRRSSEFVKVLNAPLELSHLLDASLKAFLEFSGSVAGAVFLHHSKSAVLELAAQRGATVEAFGEASVAVGEKNVGKVALSAEPLLLTRVPENAKLCVAAGHPLEAIAYVPIRFGDSLEGVLVAASTGAIDQAKLELMAQAAGQMAIAISNARAYAAAERLARELEARNVALMEQRDLLEAQKKQLVEANRLKSEFLANMTHELRTPLNAITGYTGLMADGAYGAVSGEQKEALVGIDESARNLLWLINQTLDYAKLEAGQMTVVVSEVDLTNLGREVVKAAQGLTRDKPYKIRMFAPPQPVVLSSDDGKIRQILLNLLSNAVKFTDEGTVELRVEKTPQGGAKLLVKDTGVGIAAGNTEIIFDAFRQIDGSSTRAVGGTGLGLAISRRFSQLLGGSLGVQSTPAKGSTFTLTLPVRPPADGKQLSPDQAADLDDLSAAMELGTVEPDVSGERLSGSAPEEPDAKSLKVEAGTASTPRDGRGEGQGEKLRTDSKEIATRWPAPPRGELELPED